MMDGISRRNQMGFPKEGGRRAIVLRGVGERKTPEKERRVTEAGKGTNV